MGRLHSTPSTHPQEVTVRKTRCRWFTAKARLKEYLIERQEWKNFIKKREQFKKDGMEMRRAWRLAALYFNDLSDFPAEFMEHITEQDHLDTGR